MGTFTTKTIFRILIKPNIPDNEIERLNDLRSYKILDTLPEKDFDEITLLASQICGAPISLISLIDKDRQWFKSRQGLDIKETPRDQSFCSHAIKEKGKIMIVKDSRIDERFHDNPLVLGDPNIVFYAGVPLMSSKGNSLGTLCVIDEIPRDLDPSQIRALEALGNQLGKLLEYRISLFKLNASEKKLKEINATKDKLFSIIGHDLRGPMGGIKTLVELLLLNIDTSDVEKVREMLEVIQTSANSTYELLENLLTWAKSHQDGIKFAPEDIQLNLIVSQTIDLFKELSESKELVISSEILDNVFAFADKNMLMTVLRNLISNAIKFSSKGGRIQVLSEKRDSEFLIVVKDEGTGIKAENISKLFEKTEHVSTYGTNGEKGTGLGLLLCLEFIERHGGKIWVNSELDKGSTFKFTLPFKNNKEQVEPSENTTRKQG